MANQRRVESSIVTLPLANGERINVELTFNDENVTGIRLSYTRNQEWRSVEFPMSIAIADDETSPVEERFQAAEFLMLRYTELVMKLRPELELKQPVVVRDLPEPVKRVIEEVGKLRSILEESPASGRELFRALNDLQLIEGCERCAFPIAKGKHAYFCDVERRGVDVCAGCGDRKCFNVCCHPSNSQRAQLKP